MSRLPDTFHQDRALRDAARDVLFADVEHARNTLSGKAIAGRVAGRVGDGAKDVLEVAKVNATDKQGLLAGLIAVIALWLARGPIMELLGLTEPPADDAEDAPQSNAEPGPTDATSLDGDTDQSEDGTKDTDTAETAISGSASPTDTPPEISEDESLKTGETA